MAYDGSSTYVEGDDGKGGYISGKDTSFIDGSGGFEGTRYTPDGGTQHISTYYHDGYSSDTYSSSYSGK